MNAKRPCPDCGTLFAPRGRSALCNSCSAIANVIIRSMVRQGRTSRQIASALNLTEIGVHRRRTRLAAKPVKRAKPVAVAAIVATPVVAAVKAAPKQLQVAKPFIQKCKWPSGDPMREMHVCCRPVGLACDAGDDEGDDAHVSLMTLIVASRPRSGSPTC